MKHVLAIPQAIQLHSMSETVLKPKCFSVEPQQNGELAQGQILYSDVYKPIQTGELLSMCTMKIQTNSYGTLINLE